MNAHNDKRPTVDGRAGMRPDLYAWLSIALLVAAAGLRFYDLPGRSMWLDEAAAALYSQGSLAETLDNTRHENTSPIVYPLILQAAQKIEISATSVRLPSAVFSLLAVAVMLLLPVAGTDRRTSLLAATALALSTSQVHWAQQAREYSLSVLVAALLIYGLLAFVRSDGQRRRVLQVSLFVAPLVQYGLVLFGLAVVMSVGLSGRLRNRPVLGDLVRTGSWLAAGGLISLLLTLRFQWGTYAFDHLSDHLYRGSLADPAAVLSFVAGNTYSVLKFLLPGQAVMWLFVVLVSIFIAPLALGPARFVTARLHGIDETLPFVLAFTISIVAVLLDQYPYGAAHQCLYLAPCVALAFGTTATAVAETLGRDSSRAWVPVIAIATILSGSWSLRTLNPYGEVEDVKSLLQYLEQYGRTDIPVYVYPSAVPALRFYGIGGTRYQFGKTYPQFDPQRFRSELEAAMNEGDGQLWILMTSVVPRAEALVVGEIPARWPREKKLGATKAALYLASRPETP